MGESFKAVCSFILIILLIATFFFWIDDKPSSTVWIWRFCCPLLALGVLAILLKVHFRKDLAPDLLFQTVGTYFNRGGFSFGVTTGVIDGVGYLDLYYQNQFDRPCVGKIALRPARGFFLNRARIETISVAVNCPGAAFGVVSVPMEFPIDRQGKKQAFEVGASSAYPEGKADASGFVTGYFYDPIPTSETALARPSHWPGP